MEHEAPILVASADKALRHEIAEVFGRAGFETRGFASGGETLGAIASVGQGLVLLDLDLADMSGYEVCHELRERFGEQLAIILLSGDRTEPSDRVAGLLIGADDYVTKPFDPDELLVRARRLLTRVPQAQGARDTPLTGREAQVLGLLAVGRNQQQIAKELFITSKTVGSHVQRILSKLGVHSRAEAVALAYRDGLIEGTQQSSEV